MDEKMILSGLAKLLGSQLQSGSKADGTGTAVGWYQTGGLFGTALGDNILVNALVGPKGIEGILNWVGTTAEIKYVDSISGVVITGTNATQTTACGDCQTIDTKGCTLKYPIGRFCAQTVEEQFDNLGMKTNENVPIKTLFVRITDPMGNVLVAQGTTITDRFYMDVQMVAYLLRYRLGQMIWTGDVTNSAGPVQEFDGLELIVNTGKVDAITGIACSAQNSFLLNINSNAWTSDGTYAVRSWFDRLVWQFEYRANRAGLDWETAEMHIVMTPNMWDTVSRLYACAGIDLCSLSGQNRGTASADMALQRYNEMLDRKALPIRGTWYPVIVDNMMTETDNGDGTFTSDIFFLTTRINGQDVMWGEYQDFSQTFASASQQLEAMFGRGNSDISWTDGGRFAMLKSQVRGCFDIQAIVKPRIVNRATFLSGRLQNALASPTGDEGLPDVSGAGSATDLSCGRRGVGQQGLPYLYNRAGAGDYENINSTDPDPNVFPTKV